MNTSDVFGDFGANGRLLGFRGGDGSRSVFRLPGSAYKRPGKRAFRQIGGRMRTVANGAVGFTAGVNLTFRGKPTLFRPVPLNIVNAAVTLTSWSFAPTASFGAGNAATGAWTTGTCTVGTTAGTTLAAQLAAERASMSLGCDWMPVTAIAPADGGKYKGCVRVNISNLGAINPTISESYYDLSAFVQEADGSVFRAFRQDVDGVAVPAAFTTTTTDTHPLLMAFEYMVESGEVFTVMSCGDSTEEGANGAGSMGRGWIPQALDLVRAENPDAVIEYANCSISGQPSAVYSAQAAERIPRIEPDLFVYAPGTPNDGAPTNVTTNNQATAHVTVEGVCKAACVPKIVRGIFPNTAAGWTAGQDNTRRIANRFFTGQFRMSRGYVEPDRTLWDGVSAYLPAVTADGTHPTDYGYGLLAADQGAAAISQGLFG